LPSFFTKKLAEFEGTSATTARGGSREREECKYSLSRSETPVFSRREYCVVSRLRRTLAAVEISASSNASKKEFRAPQQEQSLKVFFRALREPSLLFHVFL